LARARDRQAEIERERERLAWQIGELEKLAPGSDEWQELNSQHQRLSNAQALLDAARDARDAVGEADVNASQLTGRAIDRLDDVARYDGRLGEVIEILRGAQAQLDDAAHTLGAYLHHMDLQPERLAELDARLAAWIGLARRWRRPPAELPTLLEQWRGELRELDAAADLDALQSAVDTAKADYDRLARTASACRAKAAPLLAGSVTQAMQSLGMAGGRFEVTLVPQEAPQSFGMESVDFLVAGHAGSTPRPLVKVASGGELSRIALAVAVTTSQSSPTPTLIFDEIDAGVGGSVAENVGRLMKQLGRSVQVLAVTHLPQVAACADRHFVVSKASRTSGTATVTTSDVRPVAGEARVAEIARMLGGERLATSQAHALELLARAGTAPARTAKRRSHAS
jgi:DNA repair protein RecN (Recombination protein N)